MSAFAGKADLTLGGCLLSTHPAGPTAQNACCQIVTRKDFSVFIPANLSPFSPNSLISHSLSETRTGWMAGGGFEWMFWQRWSAKFEYLYYDLGSVTFSNGQLITGGTCSICGPSPSVVNSQSTTKFTGNIVRLGV